MFTWQKPPSVSLWGEWAWNWITFFLFKVISSERVNIIEREVCIENAVQAGWPEDLGPKPCPYGSCRSYRRNPSFVKGKRVLLLILPDPKSKMGSLAYFISKGVNQVPLKSKFYMVILASIIPSLEPGDWYSALELKDTYFHVVIHQNNIIFPRYTISGRHCQFTVLFSGLSAALQVFTKHVVLATAFLQRSRSMFFLTRMTGWQWDHPHHKCCPA